jgi:hypothetical protein
MIFHIIFSLYFSHWVLKEFLMEYQHIYVISIFSPIVPKGFKEFFPWHIHTSPDFSHRVFEGAF